MSARILSAENRAPLWTTREVAEYLSVSPETVLRWHRSGKLPGGRPLSSNCLRFEPDEIRGWLFGRATGDAGESHLVPVAERS